jgi:type I restriction enzyme M protein
LRWARFKDINCEHKLDVFRVEVFPFIKALDGRAGRACAKFMKDEVFIIQNPALMVKVVNLIDEMPMTDRL